MKKRQKQGMSLAASILSAVVILAASASLVAFSADIPLGAASHAAESAVNDQNHAVSQTLLSSYCPSQLGLADAGSYGDSAFSQSQGDLTSAAQYVATGNVYGATLGEFGKQNATALKVNGTGENAAIVANGNSAAAHVFQITILSPSDGTGAFAATASWASTGDVSGLAATSCARTLKTASFLIPSTKTGTANVLTIANPSAKPTVVSIQAWGTETSGALRLGTGARTSVAAHSSEEIDLNAVAANQNAVFLTVASSVEPVYSIVKSSVADSLTSKGVEDVPAMDSQAQTSVVLPGLSEGQKVSVRTFAHEDSMVKVSWLSDAGMSAAKTIAQKADQVSSVDLGAAPAKTHALLVEASAPVDASASAVSDGQNGQADFAIISPAASTKISGAAVPDSTADSIVLANPSAQPQKVSLSGIDAKGTPIAAQDVDVAAHSAQSVSLAQVVPGAKAVKVSQGESGSVAWALTASVDSLAKAKVAGIAVVMPTSLMADNVSVTSVRTPLASVQ